MIGRKRFELSDIRRVPVEVSPAAHNAIIRSSDEGRKLPAALSEILGAQPGITSVRVDLVPTRQHFPQVQHLEPPQQPEAMHFEIVAQHADGTPEHRWFLAAESLTELPRGPHHPGFRALRAAHDLLHTYPYKTQVQAKE